MATYTGISTTIMASLTALHSGICCYITTILLPGTGIHVGLGEMLHGAANFLTFHLLSMNGLWLNL